MKRGRGWPNFLITNHYVSIDLAFILKLIKKCKMLLLKNCYFYGNLHICSTKPSYWYYFSSSKGRQWLEKNLCLPKVVAPSRTSSGTFSQLDKFVCPKIVKGALTLSFARSDKPEKSF